VQGDAVTKGLSLRENVIGPNILANGAARAVREERILRLRAMHAKISESIPSWDGLERDEALLAASDAEEARLMQPSRSIRAL